MVNLKDNTINNVIKSSRFESTDFSFLVVPGNLVNGCSSKRNKSGQQLRSKVNSPFISSKFPLSSSDPLVNPVEWRLFFWAKLIAWTVASIGLIWQISSVSMIYFAFPTRTDIKIDSPRNLNMPGLTICLKIVLPKETPIIPLSGDLSNQSSFQRFLPINLLANFPVEDVEIICLSPWPELVKINRSAGDNCENFVTPIESIQYDYEEDQVYRCKTFFHQAPNQSEITVITKNSEHFYRVYLKAKGNFWIAVYVHNPVEVLHLNEADTFRFSTENTETITLVTSKMTTHLLAYPYQTDCINYQNQVYGRMSCVYNCRCSMVRSLCPTWPFDVPAALNEGLPFYIAGRSCQTPGRYLCSLRGTCKNACLNKWYSTALINRQEKTNLTQLTRFFVRRPFGAEVNYFYTSRMERIEFICYIASCFGTWLGFSFADLIKSTVVWLEKKSAEKSQNVKLFKMATINSPQLHKHS